MVKTITIMDDAYILLKKLKKKDESFSDVIRRVGYETKIDLKEWLGVLGTDAQRVKEFHAETKKIRQELSVDTEKRNVRS